MKGWRTGKGSPHFAKHGIGMGFKNLRSYTDAAKAFAKQGGHVVEAKVGNILFKYDHDTGRILVVSAKERAVVTFYQAANGLKSFKDALRQHWDVIRP